MELTFLWTATNFPSVKIGDALAMNTQPHIINSPTRQSRPNVVVIYHFYPHYRSAVVEALARSEVADFTFVGDDHEYLHSIEPAILSDNVKFRLAPTHLIFKPFMWQWGAIKWAIKPEFDTVIMHAVPHWPCTWIGGILARMMGKRVFFWGHGYLYEPKGFKGLIRRAFYAIPNAHMFYGRIAKVIAIKHGWAPNKLHVIYNSLNTGQQRKIRDESTKDQALEVRRQIFGNDNPVAICTTRLIAIRRLDLLIDSIHTLKQSGHSVNLILVGDGPESERLKKQAQQLGVNVHFEGACYDERRIAQLVMASSVTVAPGKVGLTAMHSMVYGVPVVTHGDASDQMPEWEAIIPDKTGSLFQSGNVQSLSDAILKWTQSQFPDSNTQKECHKIIDRFWNPDFQRQAIENAVLAMDADDLRENRGHI